MEELFYMCHNDINIDGTWSTNWRMYLWRSEHQHSLHFHRGQAKRRAWHWLNSLFGLKKDSKFSFIRPRRPVRRLNSLQWLTMFPVFWGGRRRRVWPKVSAENKPNGNGCGREANQCACTLATLHRHSLPSSGLFGGAQPVPNKM